MTSRGEPPPPPAFDEAPPPPPADETPPAVPVVEAPRVDRPPRASAPPPGPPPAAAEPARMPAATTNAPRGRSWVAPLVAAAVAAAVALVVPRLLADGDDGPKAALGTVTSTSRAATSQQQPATTRAVPRPALAAQRSANDITERGAASALTTCTEDHGASFAVDNDAGTSWLSAGPSAFGGDVWFRWEADRGYLINKVRIIGNSGNRQSALREGYGFGQVTIWVHAPEGVVSFTQRYSLAGTPDPEIVVAPNRRGQVVELQFKEPEHSCSGFAELVIEGV